MTARYNVNASANLSIQKTLACSVNVIKCYAGIRLDVTSIESYTYNYPSELDPAIDPKVCVKLNYNFTSPANDPAIGMFKARGYNKYMVPGLMIEETGQTITLGGFYLDTYSTVTEDGFSYLEYDSSPLNGNYEVLYCDATGVVIDLEWSGEVAQLGYIISQKSPLVATTSLNYIRKSIISVDLGALGIDWDENSEYTIEIDADAFSGQEGLMLPNLPESITFTSNSSPTVVDIFPGSFTGPMPQGVINETTHNSKYTSGTFKSTNTLLVLDWIRDVDLISGGDLAGDGVVRLYGIPTANLPGSYSLIKTWYTAWYEGDPSGYNYDFNKNQLILDIKNTLAEDYTYYLVVDSNAVSDYDGFPNASLSGSSGGVLQFTTDSLYFPGLKANILVESGLNDTGNRIRFGRGALTSAVSVVVDAIKVKHVSCNMSSTATIAVTIARLRKFNSIISSSATLVSSAERLKNAQATCPSTASISCTAVKYKLISPTDTVLAPNPDIGNTSGDQFGYKLKVSSAYTLVSQDFEPNDGVYVYSNSSPSTAPRTFLNPDTTPNTYFENWGRGLGQYSGTSIIGSTLTQTGVYTLPYIHAYSSSTGSLLYESSGNSAHGMITDISTDGTYLAFAGDSGVSVKMYSDGSAYWSFNAGYFQDRQVFVISGKLVVSSSGVVSIYDLASQSLIADIEIDAGPYAGSQSIAVSLYDVIVTRNQQYIDFYHLSTGTFNKTINPYQAMESDFHIRTLSTDGSKLFVSIANEDSTTEKVLGYSITTSNLEYIANNPQEYPLTSYDNFGKSIGVSGNILVVAAPLEDTSSQTSQGVIYFYTLT